MKMLTDFIRWFLYITTGILIICAVNFSIAHASVIPVQTLWWILLSGFLTTAVTVFFFRLIMGVSNMTVINCLLHYLSLCAVMIPCGCRFGWMDFDVQGIVMMMLSVAGVYLLSIAVYCWIDLKQAEEINRKLKERDGDNL